MFTENMPFQQKMPESIKIGGIYDNTFRIKEDYIDMRERENRNLTYEYYKKKYPLLSKNEIIEMIEQERIKK